MTRLILPFIMTLSTKLKLTLNSKGAQGSLLFLRVHFKRTMFILSKQNLYADNSPWYFILFTTESWLWIWRPIVICLFFHFVSPEVKTSRNLFCLLPSQFTCSRWRLITPPQRPFLLFYFTLPLLWGLKNFAFFSPFWPQQRLPLVSLVVWLNLLKHRRQKN